MLKLYIILTFLALISISNIKILNTRDLAHYLKACHLYLIGADERVLVSHPSSSCYFFHIIFLTSILDKVTH